MPDSPWSRSLRGCAASRVIGRWQGPLLAAVLTAALLFELLVVGVPPAEDVPDAALMLAVDLATILAVVRIATSVRRRAPASGSSRWRC